MWQLPIDSRFGRRVCVVARRDEQTQSLEDQKSKVWKLIKLIDLVFYFFISYFNDDLMNVEIYALENLSLSPHVSLKHQAPCLLFVSICCAV
jgi:hypothetical protein